MVLTQKCSEGNKEGASSHFNQTTDSNDINRRGRLMCFTSFHDKPLIFDTEVMRYLAYGKETCPKTGRLHWQGWVVWRNARWSFACRKQYKCWFQVCAGSLDQNEKYCEKEGQYTTFGEKPNQGERTDLEQIVKNIQEGKVSADDIALSEPNMYHQYGRTIEKTEDIFLRTKFRTTMTTGTWYVGQTGTGKSHIAFEGFDPDTHYLFRADKGWWEGYKQQKTVIINDFRGEIKYSELLQIIDKWPFYVPRRGREPMPFTSEHVIITSTLTPEEVYYNLSENDTLDQLNRRIKIVTLDNEPVGLHCMKSWGAGARPRLRRPKSK